MRGKYLHNSETEERGGRKERVVRKEMEEDKKGGWTLIGGNERGKRLREGRLKEIRGT